MPNSWGVDEAGRFQNAALARLLYESEQRHDNEAIFSIYDPDIEWDMSHYPHWLENHTYRGHAGVRAFMSAWLASWTDWEAEVEDAIELDDRVLLVVRDRARVRGSSAVIERRYGHMFTFKDGRIVKSAIYQEVGEALRDLGS
jgi:ketosteroid isomerase-like protein